MRRCKRLLTICFASIYLCVIYTDSLLSASKKSSAKKTTSSKKKTSSNKKTGKRSAAQSATTSLSNMMQDVAGADTETSAQTTTTETSVAETTNNETSSTETASESVEINIELTDDQLYKTVPSHEKWEDFKFCMQQQCMGGPEQPSNVECYKSLNFDNAFQSCKIMIGDASKYSLFEKYFKEVFLPEEQASACVSLFSGNWNAEKKTCDVTITYTRRYESRAKSSMRAKDVGCNDAKIKIVSIPTNGSSSKMNCTYESFGLGPCYEDSAKLEANKSALIMGSISVGVGALAGAAAGLTAGLKKQTEDVPIKDENGKVIGTETKIKQKDVKDRKTGEIIKKDERAGVWEGITAGLEAGKGMILDGTGQIVTAKASQNDHGEPVRGTCKLPDNTAYSEGSLMQLSW